MKLLGHGIFFISTFVLKCKCKCKCISFCFLNANAFHFIFKMLMHFVFFFKCDLEIQDSLLDLRDGTKFWSTLKKIRRAYVHTQPNNISKTDWHQHYESVFSIPEAYEPETIQIPSDFC